MIGLIVNTFSVFSVRELPAEDFKGEELSEVPADGKKVGLVDTLKTLVKNPYFDMLTMIYVLGYMSVSLSFGVAVYYFMYIMGDANRYGKLMTMYSCTSFGMKVGSGIGSGLSGWLLAASGFDAAAAVQSAACNNMPIFMFAGIPLLVTVATTIIYYFLKVEKVNRTLAS